MPPKKLTPNEEAACRRIAEYNRLQIAKLEAVKQQFLAILGTQKFADWYEFSFISSIEDSKFKMSVKSQAYLDDIVEQLHNAGRDQA